MAIDASIISGLRPVAVQTPDPLEQYGRALQIKGMMGQQNLQGIQTQEAQLGLDQTKRLNDLFANGQAPDPTSPEGQAAIISAGGMQGATLLKSLLEPKVQQSTIGMNNARAGNFNQDAIASSLKTHQSLLSNVQSPQDAAQWVQGNYADPVLGPVLAKQKPLDQAIAGIPQDPQQFQTWVQQNALGMSKYTEMNAPKITNQNIGGSSNIVATPGMGGTPQVLSSTENTFSPADKARIAYENARLQQGQEGINLRRLQVDPFGLMGTGGATSAPQVSPGAPAGASGPAPALPSSVPPQLANLPPVTGANGQPVQVPALDPNAPPMVPRGTPTGTPASPPPQGAGAGLSGMGITPDMHGQEFLAKLPAGLQGQVQALAEGRMAFPTGAAMRSPQTQQLISLVSQYDPTFDAVNYQARNATRKDFTSGASSKMLNAANTVMGHAGDLSSAADALNNGNFPLLNKAENLIGGALSPDLKARLNQFNLTKQAFSTELERAYRGSGGSQADIESWKSVLNDADSPQAMQAAIQQGVKLLGSKIDALGQQYSKGMGVTQDGLQLLNPHAQDVYNRLVGGNAPGKVPNPVQQAPSSAAIDAELRRRGVIK